MNDRNIESRLPKSIQEKAIKSSNEFGWRQFDFQTVVDTARHLRIAIIGGQVQYKLPDATCELYWLSYDTTLRQQDEQWAVYCDRTAEECLDKFNQLITQTDIEQMAVDNFELLKHKRNSGITLGDFLIFIIYFDDSETDNP